MYFLIMGYWPIYEKYHETTRTRVRKPLIEVLRVCPAKKEGYRPHWRTNPSTRYHWITGTRSTPSPVRLGLDCQTEARSIPHPSSSRRPYRLSSYAARLSANRPSPESENSCQECMARVKRGKRKPEDDH